MQEEKKNDRSGESKQNRPRKHGYFMTPPDKSGDNKASAPAVTPVSDAAQSKDEKRGGRFHHNKNKKNLLYYIAPASPASRKPLWG